VRVTDIEKIREALVKRAVRSIETASIQELSLAVLALGFARIIDWKLGQHSAVWR
jgi:hypothetical protein